MTEHEFMRAVAQRCEAGGEFKPRDLIAESDVPPKRAWYWLDKWCRRGWYDYGVTIDLGWLTQAGRERAEGKSSPEGGRE